MELVTRLACMVLFFSAVSEITAAPASGHAAPGSVESLHSIIVELENVLYKLKDYARELQASTKLSVGSEAELQSAAGRPQQGTGGAPKAPTASQSGEQEGSNDISLREALEYLMALSKQKKVERRDHDIPFPLSDREGQ